MSAENTSSTRPPFDPSRIRAEADDGGPRWSDEGGASPATMTVTQLTQLVRGAIRKALPSDVHVVGELSNVSAPSGGHLYFTLKDDTSEVRCVMWRSSAKLLRFRIEDGLEVVATGSVDVYEPRGQYQFYVGRMEPRGTGALELAFRQLKERLEKEGLFDPRRKRRLPRFPERIAVVTSPTGAAVRDILQTIQRRYPCVCVYVFGVRVQGEGAAAEVADAIRRINHASAALGGVDVMIVGRGGGSIEDLWAFNEEVVARAIHTSQIPIVSAVGHEVDFTIADFVADARAATPTAAAELVVPVRAELVAEIDGRQHRLVQAVQRLLDGARARLSMLERSEWFRDPVGRVRRRHQQVDEVAGRLQLAVSRAWARRRSAMHSLEVRLVRVRPEALLARRRALLAAMEHRLRWAQGRYDLTAERRLREVSARLLAASPQRLTDRGVLLVDQLAGRLFRGISRLVEDNKQAVAALDARLAASSHQQILGRGFSITRHAKTRKIVRRPADVRVGDRLRTETADGKIASRVIDERQGELFE
ncbi:MAG: exodeoxyribonuclease VII large subunit [Phycisphaerae bacterium]|nr:exodeoxyribonuclease VII large subunit [Phycisphaerae bacterium]